MFRELSRLIKHGVWRQPSKTWSCVTAGTTADIHWIVARESALSVMTLEAIVAGSGAVLKDRYISYLAADRRSGNDRVTLTTVYRFVITVRENGLKIVL